MAIMRISRFRDSPETVLAFKHLSDFAEIQPVQEPVATLNAMDIELPMASPRHASRLPQHDAWQPRRWASVTILCSLCDLDLERRHVQNLDTQRAATV
jgi:hypothetical protein